MSFLGDAFGAIAPSAILGSVGSLIGGERRNSAQRHERQAANRFSADQAQLNRDFQERMSNTAVSRRMADMRSSGINPILAAQSQASSPAGNAPTGQQAQIQDIITPAVSTAIQANQVTANIEKIDQEIKNLNRQLPNISADTYLKSIQAALANANTDVQQATIEKIAQEISILEKDAVINAVKARTIIEGLRIFAPNNPVIIDLLNQIGESGVN